MAALFETNLSLPGRRRGKVRDVYEIPGTAGEASRLLIVASDRISAFDVVMPTPIAGKGAVLTEIATKWFRWIELKGLAKTHLISTDVEDVPGLSAAERESLRGRVTIGRKCRVVPVECVARGYLAGSGWVDYQKTGTVCGVKLRPGLRTGDRLEDAQGRFAPIFTPATKEELGKHDENISYEQACAIAGEDVMRRLRDATLAIYSAAHEHALSRGVILADTKFEWGFPLDARGEPTGEGPILVDEALTPDSSRYWPKEDWRPGREQPSYDKQYLREYLLELVAAGKWGKQAPGPELPEAIVRNTLAKYEEARRRLFG